MAFDGENELFNVIYIAKKLFDMGKYDLVEENFVDKLDYEAYYENMYGLIEGLFEHCSGRYYEHRSMEIHVVSDSAMVGFYVLAGRYGRRNNIPDLENPYILDAEREVNANLNISHCLDWKLMWHTEPKRPFHSRLGLFISHECGCLDLGCLAYRLIETQEWFVRKQKELFEIMDDTMGGLQLSLLDLLPASRLEVMAA